MEIINTTFRIGVILAIFGFIWSLIKLAIVVLSGGKKLEMWQNYSMRLIQYYFLVQVTFLFCFEANSPLSLSENSLVITGLILLIYFISKLQNRQQNKLVLSIMMNRGMAEPKKEVFDLRAEIGLVVFGMTFFIVCVFYQYLAENKVSIWFKEAIINIEDTPIFGFIFKVVGFFFLLSIFGKIGQTIALIFNPKASKAKTLADNNKTNNQDQFDDFEDVTEKD